MIDAVEYNAQQCVVFVQYNCITVATNSFLTRYQFSLKKSYSRLKNYLKDNIVKQNHAYSKSRVVSSRLVVHKFKKP